MMVTWSAVTPMSMKALVIPFMSAAFCSSLFPDHVSMMTTGVVVSPPALNVYQKHSETACFKMFLLSAFLLWNMSKTEI
jgi:hypothetical protein